MTRELPQTPRAFQKRWPKFKGWLEARGSEVRVTTNAYELARFTTPEGVGVVYRNGRDVITSWEGGADTAFLAFVESKSWRCGERVRRSKGRDRQTEALLRRDGNRCFFCDGIMAPKGEPCEPGQEMTREHLVPLTQGGPNCLANLFLAHGRCNQEAGHKPAVEKIRLRDKMRQA